MTVTPNDRRYLERACLILHHMSLEHTGWRRWFRRWYISDEPLRHDAANLLEEIGCSFVQPDYTKRVNR